MGPTAKLLAILLSAAVLSSTLVLILPPQESVSVDWEMPPLASERIFPLFNRSNDLHVLNASDISFAKQLALVSLQGIVNREQSRIYIDFEGESERSSSLLGFLASQYNVSLNHTSFDGAFELYSDYLNGIVVYDDSNKDTVNIATMLSGIHDLVIADADLALELSETYGLDISYDLRESPWRGLDDEIEIYNEALSSLYPSCGKRLIAILTPSKLKSRDYVIATKSFVFYVPQGPMTSDANIRFMKKVLESTPENIPIMGWFPSPSGAEENYYIQMTSQTGKMAMGGENFPNLSVLAAFQPPAGLQQSFDERDPELEDKIYVTISVPDGDNIDFMRERMREIWNDDLRGSIPISWSSEPLLGELAPVFLEYYYNDATALDTFVAGPSGAGYIYPDFVSDEDLNLYLWRTKRLLNETDIDIVWLLNSFTSYETPYSPSKLDGYAQILEPEAMILDYGDTAVRRSYWVERTESGVGVPVIRSTHAWGDIDNFLGKVTMEVETYRERPHFLFVPIMPWTIALEDAVDAIDELNGWYEGEFEVVSVHEFFKLFKKAMISRARERLDEISRNPFAGAFAGGSMKSAKSETLLAEEKEASGDLEGATAHASLALKHLEDAEGLSTLVLLILLVILLVIVALFLLVRKKIRVKTAVGVRQILLVLLLLFGVSLFYLSFFHILYTNFWNYLTFVSIAIAVPMTLLLMRYFPILRKPSSTMTIVAAVTLSISSGLVLIHGLALGLVAAFLILLFSSMRETPKLRGSEYVVVFLGGLLISMFLQLQLVTVLVLSTWLIALSFGLHVIGNRSMPLISEKVERMSSRRTMLLSLTVSLLLIPLLIPFSFAQSHYFSLAAGFNIPFLESLGVLALISSIVLGPLLYAAFTVNARFIYVLPLIGLFALIWLLVFFFPSLLLLGMVAIFSQLLATLAFLRVYDLSFNSEISSLDILPKYALMFVLFGFVVVMPPLSYSLYLFPLPSSVVFFLYSPPLMISAFSALILLPLLFFLSRKTPKDLTT